MPCEPVFVKGKLSGWLCSRGKTTTKDFKCSICGAPATCLCDYRDGGVREGKDKYGRKQISPWFSLATCDRPLCSACATHLEENMDFCPEHANELAILRTQRAEASYRAELHRMGLVD